MHHVAAGDGMCRSLVTGVGLVLMASGFGGYGRRTDKGVKRASAAVGGTGTMFATVVVCPVVDNGVEADVAAGVSIVVKTRGIDESGLSRGEACSMIDDGMVGMKGPAMVEAEFTSVMGVHDSASIRGFEFTTCVAVVTVEVVGAMREALAECTTIRGPGVRNMRNAEIAHGTTGVRTVGFAPDLKAAVRRVRRIRLLILVVLRRRI